MTPASARQTAPGGCATFSCNSASSSKLGTLSGSALGLTGLDTRPAFLPAEESRPFVLAPPSPFEGPTASANRATPIPPPSSPPYRGANACAGRPGRRTAPHRETVDREPDSFLAARHFIELPRSGLTACFLLCKRDGFRARTEPLSLNTNTGVISGTPTAPGTSTFTVKVTDSGSPAQSTTQSLTIVIDQGLTITTTSLPNGTA
ncbi:MAG: Ig domain-containing protein [Acidobacteriia bacterium]|nr:Ig domain-containing protein [Terriglobia bacterium]